MVLPITLIPALGVSLWLSGIIGMPYWTLAASLLVGQAIRRAARQGAEDDLEGEGGMSGRTREEAEGLSLLGSGRPFTRAITRRRSWRPSRTSNRTTITS